MLTATLAPLAQPDVAGAAPVAGASAPQAISTCATTPGWNPSNAEPISAIDGSYVYVAWIGCWSSLSGIAVATSSDGGRTFAAPVLIPAPVPLNLTRGMDQWDPALAVGPNHDVYLAYMSGDICAITHDCGANPTPISVYVASSTDHGRTFSAGTALEQASGSTPTFADRPFIAVAPDGTIAVSYDFSPNASLDQLLCSPTGSCSYGLGDYNAVVQVSSDGGATWSPQIPIDPNYPFGGEWSAAIVAQPNSTFDVFMWDHVTDPTTYALSSGPMTFSHSSPDGLSWSTPRVVSSADVPLTTWWIDGSIGIDAAGTLYVAWDAQAAGGDVPYLAYSMNDGATWSAPIALGAPLASLSHLVSVVGGSPGVGYLEMQTGDAAGYQVQVAAFSPMLGLLAPWQSISPTSYDPTVWPGDTVGLSYGGLSAGSASLETAWGGALPTTGSTNPSEIWTSTVALALPVPARPRGLTVGASGTTLTATWLTSPGATSYTCTLEYGFAAPSSFSVTTTSAHCAFAGAAGTMPLGVAVVANGLGGASSVAEAFAPPARWVCVRGRSVRVPRPGQNSCPHGFHRRAR